MTTKPKRRKLIVIQTLLDGYLVTPFEIKLPNDAAKVTGVMVTARETFFDGG